MIGKRIFDIAVGVIGLILAAPLLAGIALAVRWTSSGPALHWSSRIGRNNIIFKMPKFRTMRIDTPQLPTHLLTNAQAYVTPLGRILRATSFDELPQLWSVVVGQMSLVGPRPALFNQDDLVALRTEAGVHRLAPGVTGWAQVNGRDDLPIPVKVQYDTEYLCRRSLLFDLRIIAITVVHAVAGRGVWH